MTSDRGNGTDEIATGKTTGDGSCKDGKKLARMLFGKLLGRLVDRPTTSAKLLVGKVGIVGKVIGMLGGESAAAASTVGSMLVGTATGTFSIDVVVGSCTGAMTEVCVGTSRVTTDSGSTAGAVTSLG